MKFSEMVIEILTEYPRSYQEARRQILGLPEFKKSQKELNEESLRTILSRLKKNGLLEHSNGMWKATQSGLKKLTRKNWRGFKKNTKKNLIIAFDIPESLKKKRDWLRMELMHLGFIKLQNSVWFGPAPLPKEFMAALQELKLISYIKFFEAKESSII